MADKTGMPYLRVSAMTCSGLAKATAGRFVEGAHDLREAIDFGHRIKAGLEYEARMLASLADTLFRARELDAALEVAKESVAVARRKTDRIGECHAAVVQGMILANSGEDVEARRLLERAEYLLKISRAALLEPTLFHFRSQLERAIQ